VRSGGGATRTGSLTVVGTGIDVVTQLTPASQAAIGRADEVLYLVADPVSALRVEELNPKARSLDGFYAPEKDRRETYAEIVDEIAATVRRGVDVCVVLYGHPGVFAFPGHAAVARLRAEGIPARMLPAVSSLDCLFADLGVDPATGFQAYEATSFVAREPPVDPSATLVLLQVGMVGVSGGTATPDVASRFGSLAKRLAELYGGERDAILYEASPYPGAPPGITSFRLGDTEPPAPPLLATLCVPGPGARA
jgi:precorrin-6B methylase 1